MSSIINSEMRYYKPLLVSNTPSNGGYMSNDEYPDNTRNAIFGFISVEKLLSGTTVYRKLCIRNINATDENVPIQTTCLTDITPEGTTATIFRATASDVEASITGSERKYAAGRLNADTTGGGKTISASFETGMGALNVLQAGDKIKIAGDGDSQYLVVDTAVWTGDNVAITTVTTIDSTYTLAGACTVSSCIEDQNVQPTADAMVVTSTAGLFDDTGYPLTLKNNATIEQDWTITFTSAIEFTVSGNTKGVIGSGNVTTNFAVDNPDFAAPFFTLLAGGFSGTFVAGDSITFTTHANAVYVWWKYNVPANTPNSATLDTSTINSIMQS